MDNGKKLAVGTAAGLNSKVWFTVAKGVTSEVFYPRLDVPNMEDMQYVITDGSTFVDLERDATCDLHADGNGARVHRNEYGSKAVAQISDYQHLHR